MDRTGQDDSFEHLDADAVCERCSTVNPQGTLLCKTCGNNLRDQRAERLAGEGAAEPMPVSERPRRVLAHLLAILGLLLILWVGFNVDRIETWMTRGFEKAVYTNDSDKAWTGSDRAIYDDLLATLDAHPISPAEIALASSQPLLTGGYDGRYIIKRGEGSSPVIGQGIARTQADTVYFVCRLAGDTEIRGSAQVSSPTTLTVELAGVRSGDTYSDSYGIGETREAGRIECSGYLDRGDTPYSAVIFRVPETPGGGPLVDEPPTP